MNKVIHSVEMGGYKAKYEQQRIRKRKVAKHLIRNIGGNRSVPAHAVFIKQKLSDVFSRRETWFTLNPFRKLDKYKGKK